MTPLQPTTIQSSKLYSHTSLNRAIAREQRIGSFPYVDNLLVSGLPRYLFCLKILMTGPRS
jgi:hypothetical protein